jgi:signal transduction histidine kinase
VTTLSTAEAAALDRERLSEIAAVAAQITHDLGNPVAAIVLQMELILRQAREGAAKPLSSVVEPLERLAEEVRRLRSLLRDLGSFSRGRRLTLAPVAAAPFLDDVAETWRAAAADRRVHLAVDAGAAGIARADAQKLRCLLDHLVKNALEAIGEGPGTVSLRSSELDGARVRISVIDSGPGVAPEVRLFRLFESTKESGSGIGLVVSRQIVRAHGGDLRFERLEPRGSAFHVDLPAAAT